MARANSTHAEVTPHLDTHDETSGKTGRGLDPGEGERKLMQAVLSEAIVWVIEHETERRAMAERGRTACAEAFSAERMVGELELVYERALTIARTANRN